MELTGWSRKKTAIINCVSMIVLSMPCVLGFNLLSFIKPLGPGSGIMDLEDFLVSNLILPIGSLIYLLFCVSKKGWGIFQNSISGFCWHRMKAMNLHAAWNCWQNLMPQR
jgi:SNF family Na+-dependent transporter